MRNSKRRLCIFIAANILTAMLLHLLLANPSQMRTRMHEFREDRYTTIVLGQSHGATSVNPFLLDEGPEDQAFSFAYMQTPYKNFYYQIVEANRTHPLKRVFYEVESFYMCTPGLNLQVGKGNHIFFHLSPLTQLEYFANEMLQEDYNQVLFDYKGSLTAVKNMAKCVRAKFSSDYLQGKHLKVNLGVNSAYKYPYEYQGRGFDRGYGPSGVPYAITQFSRDSVSEDALKYLRKSARYCRDHNIEMVCYVSALPPYRLLNENHGEVHDFLEEICREERVMLLDANYIRAEYFPRTDEDYVDIDGHMMGYLADRQSELFREIVNSPNPEIYFEDSYQAVQAGLQKGMDQAS